MATGMLDSRVKSIGSSKFDRIHWIAFSWSISVSEKSVLESVEALRKETVLHFPSWNVFATLTVRLLSAARKHVSAAPAKTPSVANANGKHKIN